MTCKAPVCDRLKALRAKEHKKFNIINQQFLKCSFGEIYCLFNGRKVLIIAWLTLIKLSFLNGLTLLYVNLV